METDLTDDKIVRTYIKIRGARTALSKEYDAKDKALKEQLAMVAGELLRRLNERGATQTKTDAGTAFIGEDMSITIADSDMFKGFVEAQHDLNWYVQRVKVERLREYMKANGGNLPPGLNVFRERTILVRAPKKESAPGVPEVEEFEPNAAAAA